MSKKNVITETMIGSTEDIKTTGANQEYVSTCGIRVSRVNGQEMLNLDDMQAFLCAEIAKLPKETRPNVLAAQDARQVITELTLGIGGDMDKFKEDSKRFLTDLHQTKYAVMGETREILGQLKELRQFFLGADYADQIKRLKEFVELCERLNALKNSGFLDKVADTMLKLA